MTFTLTREQLYEDLNRSSVITLLHIDGIQHRISKGKTLPAIRGGRVLSRSRPSTPSDCRRLRSVGLR